MRALARLASLALLLAVGAGAGCRLDPAGRCEARAECAAGLDCIDGICTNCRGDHDCRGWEACDAGFCNATAGNCNADADCPAWESCQALHLCQLRPGRCADTAACADPLLECDPAHVCSFVEGKCNAASDCPAWMGGCTANACTFSAAPTAASDDVLAFGTLAEGRGDRGAISRVTAPAKVETGLDVGSAADGRSFVDPVTGGVVYRHVGDPGGDTLRRFRRDAISTDPATGHWVYPGAPSLNDAVALVAAFCPATWDHWVMNGATGALLYGCPVSGGLLRDYYDAAGIRKRQSVAVVHAWSANGFFLETSSAGQFRVVTAAGVPTAVTGLPAGSLLAVRTLSPAAGFNVAWSEAGADRLYAIDETTGVASLVNTYPAVASSYTGTDWNLLGSDGALYSRAFQTSELILKRPLGVASSVTKVYDEGSATTGSNDFTAAVFSPWLKLDASSSLLTRP